MSSQDIKFNVGDRVVVCNESLTTNGERGTVTAIKPNGLVVVKFDSADPRGGRSHNAFRASNLNNQSTNVDVQEQKQDSGASDCVQEESTSKFVVTVFESETQLVQMMVSNDEDELVERIVHCIHRNGLKSPGVKVIKAPIDHRWSSDAYNGKVVAVKPNITYKPIYSLTVVIPEKVTVYVDQYEIKLPHDSCNALGYAVKAAHMVSCNLMAGSSIKVLGESFKIGYGREHNPEREIIQITNMLHLYRVS